MIAEPWTDGETAYGSGPGDRLRYLTDVMLATVDALWGADFDEDSRLEGWTFGHVVTQLARDADLRADELALMRTGITPVFDPDRRWDPNPGHLRPGAVIIDDVLVSLARFRSELGKIPESTWEENNEVLQIVRGRIHALENHLAALGVHSAEDARKLFAATTG
ncbi:maleylpyruvate isomerase N-terminal domain-containing protein [Arthrobacter sp. SD76]|uniref:maleylpyruvate isomerase N-terminal domain-containing protein n=1 Tax=Arthrobacter sp. SD76 TaxID=3415007 RepID=UPI003C77E7DC